MDLENKAKNGIRERLGHYAPADKTYLRLLDALDKEIEIYDFLAARGREEISQKHRMDLLHITLVQYMHENNIFPRSSDKK